MQISDRALNLVGCTLTDYVQWCEDNNKEGFLKKTREEFFTNIRLGKIVRDKSTGKLVNRFPRDVK